MSTARELLADLEVLIRRVVREEIRAHNRRLIEQIRSERVQPREYGAAPEDLEKAFTVGLASGVDEARAAGQRLADAALEGILDSKGVDERLKKLMGGEEGDRD